MKWQYMATEDESSLNRLGQEGWELVAVVEQKDKDKSWPKFYLKRPLPGFKEQITDQQRQKVYSQLGIGE